MLRGLQVAIVYADPPDLIEVRVTAGNGVFAGEVDAYAPTDAIAELARGLAGFPTSSDDERSFTLGNFGTKLAGGAAALRFFCVDGAAHPAAEVTLEAADSAKLTFRFEPSGLDAFVVQLRALHRTSDPAVLPAI